MDQDRLSVRIESARRSTATKARAGTGFAGDDALGDRPCRALLVTCPRLGLLCIHDEARDGFAGHGLGDQVALSLGGTGETQRIELLFRLDTFRRRAHL